MSDPLIDFINKLDQDPEVQLEYSKAPKETLIANGVSNKDVTLLLSGDLNAIKERLGMSDIKAILIISI